MQPRSQQPPTANRQPQRLFMSIHVDLCCKVILYITLSSYTLYLSPKQGFEHMTEYRPEAVAKGRYSVTCSNLSFGGENIMRTNLT